MHPDGTVFLEDWQIDFANPGAKWHCGFQPLLLQCGNQMAALYQTSVDHVDAACTEAIGIVLNNTFPFMRVLYISHLIFLFLCDEAIQLED